ncbi:glycosyltransferase family 4 protein [Micromonospora rubida]|uniref:glycosyltransferase family 4 protein n=1 Tax=Micromonospora rubida TaxID=2697657 RepID=UPI0013769814|nr:glycosyltransferase family 4 protein [Micromonospora rubida]NBE80187.1 glycosyltransferase [Micromonospora rubida]
MTDSASGRAVVKFVEEIDSAARDGLTARLAAVGLAPRVGFDLGHLHLEPERRLPTAVLTLFDGLAELGAQQLTQVTHAARDWLVSVAVPGFVEVEFYPTGQVARIRASDPDRAAEALSAVLANSSTDAPLTWNDDRWAAEPARTAGRAAGPPPRVLALDTHWFSAKGGMSTFNRSLCAALARAGADVVCVVPQPGPDEIAHARVRGVTLVAAPPPVAGGAERDGLARRPRLADGWVPDLVIGHGRITGGHARAQVEDNFRSAARAHIVHTWSDHIEWQRGDRPDAGAIADQRWQEDIELARTATRAFGVGPLLHGLLQRDLSGYPDTRSPDRIDPGFDLDDQLPRVPPSWHQRQVMLMGRIDDWSVKGIDLAARAVGSAVELLSLGGTEPELVLRGVPPTEHGRVRDQVLQWAGRRTLQVTPRTYSTSEEELRADLRRACLALMPSRAEAFGLVGREAIVAGTPLLVSARSGLGMLLHEVLPPRDAALTVLPVDDDESADTKRWAFETARILRDPAGAFVVAERIRQTMAERVTNDQAAASVLGTLS